MEAFNAAQVDLMGAMEKTSGLSGYALQEKLKEGIGFDDVAAAIRELAKEGGPLKDAEKEVEKLGRVETGGKRLGQPAGKILAPACWDR